MLNRSAELTSALSTGLMIDQEIFHEFVEGMGGEMLEPSRPWGTLKEGIFVERYGKEMSRSRQKINLLILIVV